LHRILFGQIPFGILSAMEKTNDSNALIFFEVENNVAFDRKAAKARCQFSPGPTDPGAVGQRPEVLFQRLQIPDRLTMPPLSHSIF
jgi:hypothetical protein